MMMWFISNATHVTQTESPSAPGSRKTSGDQATTLPRQKTAPVFVPGSLPGEGHVQVQPQSYIAAKQVAVC